MMRASLCSRPSPLKPSRKKAKAIAVLAMCSSVYWLRFDIVFPLVFLWLFLTFVRFGLVEIILGGFYSLYYIIPQSYGFVKFLARVLAQRKKKCNNARVMKNTLKLCYRVMRKNENVTQDVTLENGLTMRVRVVL